MIVHTTPRLATVGPRLRQAVLVLFALFVSHDLIYIGQFGMGEPLAAAMAAGGRHDYWVPVSLVIGAAVAAVFLACIALMARLELQAPGRPRRRIRGPSYLDELGATWLRLFPTVALLFLLQENVERFFADGTIPGLSPIAGAGAADTLPILAATTFVLAALGSLVRWRIQVLEARITASTRTAYPPARAIRRPRRWASIAAAVAHGWILARGLAGRAPPRILLATAVPTA